MSAVIAGGPPSRVVERVYGRDVELVLPEAVAIELGRVLTKKFDWDPEHAVALIDELARLAADIPKTPTAVPNVTGERLDDAILACAVEVKADVLVTGDNHLLPLGEHQGVRIVRPQELLAELSSD